MKTVDIKSKTVKWTSHELKSQDMKIQNCWNWQTSTKTMHSFCKMVGQLLQTELDHCTTVSYTASACSSELTASVVSWTAFALKCTQQTTRCKKSQSNSWTCLQSSSNDMHEYCKTDNDAPELCKHFFWTMHPNLNAAQISLLVNLETLGLFFQ